MQGRDFKALFVAASMLALGGAAPAEPWLGSVTWTTYLHDGPGKRYRVVDEVQAATRVQVLGCSDEWCRVFYDGAAGYLPQDLLVPTAAAPPATAASSQAACFDARRAGYAGGKIFAFCPK